MAVNHNEGGLGGNPIYTLAQTRTTYPGQFAEKPEIMVQGEGSDLTDAEGLKGRTRRKLITQNLSRSLVDVAVKKGELERAQAYWNTYHCQNEVITQNGKLYGKYCKNRFCTVCASIRKAQKINEYLPVIEQWPEPYFVTLTVKSVKVRSLKKVMRGMIRGFQLIHDRQRKRHERGKGIKLLGIKSLECNFNPEPKTYNPHYHLIVPDKETAELVINEWLKQWTKKWANRKAQNMRKVTSLETDLVETIKYGTKIFTDPEGKKYTKKTKGNPKNGMIYVSAMDNIFAAMQGLRVFDRFGFNLPKSQKPDGASLTVLTEYDKWEFVPEQGNWINIETGRPLTDYMPGVELSEALKNRINNELE